MNARAGVRTEAFHRLVPRPEGGAILELALTQTGPLAWLTAIPYGRLTRRYVGMEAHGAKRAAEKA